MNNLKQVFDFIDTPGIYKKRYELSQYMRGQALKALKGVDLVLFMTDRDGEICNDDKYILSRIRQHEVPGFLVLNKVDQMEKGSVLLTMDLFQQEFPFKEFFPISALQAPSTYALEEKILSYLEEGPFYFPGDVSTDQTEKFLISELAREKVFQLTNKGHYVASLIML